MKFPSRDGTTNQIVGLVWFALVCLCALTGLVGLWRIGAQFFSRTSPMDWSGFWLIAGAWVAWSALERFLSWYQPSEGER